MANLFQGDKMKSQIAKSIEELIKRIVPLILENCSEPFTKVEKMSMVLLVYFDWMCVLSSLKFQRQWDVLKMMATLALDVPLTEFSAFPSDRGFPLLAEHKIGPPEWAYTEEIIISLTSY